MPSERLPGRLQAAFADLIVWTAIWLSLAWLTDTLVRAVRHLPPPPGPDPRDGLVVFSFGLAALFANFYLAVSAANGWSVGKSMYGLRLVAWPDGGRPGLARGLVRSSLQGGPYMGLVTVWTGAHDTFAGTRIVTNQQWNRDYTLSEPDRENDTSRVPAWKVAFAIVLHVFFAFVYVIVAAI
jgi:uncharacterized RDD family membrane protein YckC